jgi:alkanesulfonate monooxygenase SsuD/methylene tetrahydromethanopterin reductase-like flavin-dependent oxidoreductase (luciferase family)
LDCEGFYDEAFRQHEIVRALSCCNDRPRGKVLSSCISIREEIMKFGLIIRGQYPEGDDMRLRHQEDLDTAKRAEQLGYDLVAKGSHYSSHPFQYIQQIPYLAQVAICAPKLRLCPGVVLLPLHSPLHVAEELASLDVMSNGKLIFGAGIGYREVEFNAFGTTLKSAGKRFEECLTGVKRLWSEDFVSMDASYFKFDGVNCTTKPIQKPMPPIWIGANIDVGIRRAARMADAWFINPHNKLDTTAQQIEVYKRALDVAGKPFPSELPMAREVFVARSRDEAVRLAAPYLETKYRAYRAWGQDKVMPASDHFDLNFEALMEDRFLFGSPAQVTEQILDLHKRFGVTTLILGIHWAGMPASLAQEEMQLLSEEVFPAVNCA